MTGPSKIAHFANRDSEILEFFKEGERLVMIFITVSDIGWQAENTT